MKRKKVRGGEVTTTTENQDILGVKNGKNTILTNVTVINKSEERIHIIINGGDQLPLDPDESMSLGDISVDTIEVVEKRAVVRYIGVE